MTFTSDHDERIVIRMGQRGFETVTNLLTDMLANMPSYDNMSSGTKAPYEPELQQETVSTIFLMSGRKQWYHELPPGWREVAFERFDYVECGVFEKPTSALTDQDHEWVKNHGDHPEGWITPTPGRH